jgi:hypothetical protein
MSEVFSCLLREDVLLLLPEFLLSDALLVLLLLLSERLLLLLLLPERLPEFDFVFAILFFF